MLDFAALASCYQAQFEVDKTGEYGELLRLVRQHTFNIFWVDEIIAEAERAKYPGASFFLTEKESWESDMRDTIDNKLHEIRQKQYSTTQDRDLPGMANAYLEEGNLMFLQGEFRAAHQCYQIARGTHKSVEYEGMISLCCADLLQRHWSIVQTSLNKLLKTETEETPRLVLQTYGLASWCLGDYGDCASAFLQLQDLKDNPWINEETAASILTISALLTMSREHLQYFMHSEAMMVPVFEAFPQLREFVAACHSLDIAKTWSILSSLTDVISKNYFAHGRLKMAIANLRERLHQQYLAVRRLTHLTPTLELFSLLQQCTVFNLAEDAKRWGIAIEVDTVADTIEVKTEAPRSEMLEQTSNLVHRFIYDGAMLIWSKTPDSIY